MVQNRMITFVKRKTLDQSEPTGCRIMYGVRENTHFTDLRWERGTNRPTGIL